MVENALLEIPTGLIEASREWVPRQCRSSVKCCYRKRCRSGECGNYHPDYPSRLFRDGCAVGAGGLGQIGYQYGYIGYTRR